jgi:predicted nucleic acid-binding protein
MPVGDYGMLDTSVLIAAEAGRRIAEDDLPAQAAISAVTFGELQLGVLAAADVSIRARRLATLDRLSTIKVLALDHHAAARWAELRMHVAQAGRSIGINDLWIAATALAHDLALYTQDEDFDAVAGVAGLEVVVL